MYPPLPLNGWDWGEKGLRKIFEAMTQTTTAKNNTLTKNSDTHQSVIFINWEQPVGSLDTCNLFDNTDFTKYDLVFFDPYQFALSIGLRTNEKDFSEAEYINLDEKEFIEYLRKAKQATKKLKTLLENDGTLIVRSGIPKGHIKVRKKTSASIRAYTESVLSTFFWLDEVFGKSSFQDCQSNILKYVNQDLPLADIFRSSMIKCHQAQISIGRGFTRTLAIGGPSGKLPLITKVNLKPEPGQIYFIPQFLIQDEHEKLVTAFSKMRSMTELDTVKPAWMEYYEKQVLENNPVNKKIEEVDRQIDALAKQRGVLAVKLKEGNTLPDLLWEQGLRLREAIEKALGTLGLEVRIPPSEFTMTILEGPIDSPPFKKIMINIAEPNADPIQSSVVEKFITMLDERPRHPKVKGIIIGNGMCSFPPEKRKQCFDNAGVSIARKKEICLLSVFDLFTMAALILSRSGTENQALIKNSLVKDILDCEGQYQLNRQKYGI